MKNIFLPVLICIVFYSGIKAQQLDSANALSAIKKFQADLNEQYKNETTSPLYPKDRKKFKEHDFYPIDLKYRVKAKLKVTPDEDFFDLKTSSGKSKIYRKYGEITFKIDDRDFKLNVYQGKSLMENDEYKNYLFLPFKDFTSGNETYGGGRYIDLWIPEGDEIIVDFNQAYNPYCAYSDKFNCPIVPVDNYLETEIKAGFMLKDKLDFKH